VTLRGRRALLLAKSSILLKADPRMKSVRSRK